MTSRGIDTAMAASRLDKARVRELWCEKVAEAVEAAGTDTSVPAYSTLPGRQAMDLEALHAGGIIKRLPNGAIDQSDAWKVAALESDGDAAMSLRESWPGLDLRCADVKSVLASDAPTSWPPRRQRRFCRGRVVNLDYNGALAVAEVAGAIEYPQIKLVQKFAQLHVVAGEPSLDWTLCLTLAADLQWPNGACDAVREFLRENCDEHAGFAGECQRVLGENLFARLLGHDPASWMRSLSAVDRQGILMVLVPKRILHDTYHQRWAISVGHNLRYGGDNASKAMVSFVVDFRREPRVAATPRAVYKECLGELLRNAGEVTRRGDLRRLA